MKKTLLASVLFYALSTNLSLAQCALIPVELPERISGSDLIVEAEISAQRVFVSAEDGHIYTASYLDIYKIFKGQSLNSQIVLISPGGFINGQGEEVVPSIFVEHGIKGIFFLYHSNIISETGLDNYKPFSGPQACIYYNLQSGTANDVFSTYSSITDIYTSLENLTQQTSTEIKKLEWKKSVMNKATVIHEISPPTSAAGIRAEVIIKGEDFGASQGSGTVSFTNASTGPTWTELVTSQYRLWTDTLIIVQVPSRAGTGAIKVTTSQGTGIIGSPTILFSHLNNYNFTKVLYPFHKDDNGNGGFTWTMSNAFNANNGAKNAFLRAMNIWRDQTCINWENGPFSSTNQDSKDGVNNVRFANAGELESGVLGITRNYWTDCQGNVAYPDEIDLSYDPSTNWYTGTSIPNFTQMDMESVIVHELGHAHQLGHVINTGDFMHATIGPGQSKRNLINNNIESGLYVMKNSAVAAACGPDPMVPITGCSVPIGIQNENKKMDVLLYPNPFSQALFIEQRSSETFEMEIYSTTGELVGNMTVYPGMNKWEGFNGLPNGMYILKSYQGVTTFSGIVIKE